MKLSVIIVNFNVKYYVEQCLNSLNRALQGIDSEIFVVDNHSKDDSVGYITHRFRNVTVIDCNHNLGFARANNIAIRCSEGEYVLLLNPDTIVCEDTIEKCLAFMDTHPKAGGAGVLMFNPDGTYAPESRRGLPTPLTSFYKMSGLCSRFPNSRTLGRYYMGFLPWDEPAKIDIVSGAFCLLRRKALDQIGCLDEDFFMYGEDIDLSYRLLKGGFDNWYLPYPILHYKGESTQKTSFRYVHVFYQAMLIFFKKHYGHLSFCITLPIKAAVYVKAAAALVKMQSYRLRKSLGFTYKRLIDPCYLFVGNSQMIDNCMVVAKRKGLAAYFLFCESLNIEILTKHISDMEFKTPVCIVFDTDTFSYKQILETMSGISGTKVVLGTYSSKTRIVITPREIIK